MTSNAGQSVSGQTRAAASIDEPVASVCLSGSVHHSKYVDLGAETALADHEKPSLGSLLVVVDSDGWATAHRVTGIYRRQGRRTVAFGPRVPWPDGSIGARNMARIAPDFDAERRAELERTR